jgi:hypothetical protein
VAAPDRPDRTGPAHDHPAKDHVYLSVTPPPS